MVSFTWLGVSGIPTPVVPANSAAEHGVLVNGPAPVAATVGTVATVPATAQPLTSAFWVTHRGITIDSVEENVFVAAS